MNARASIGFVTAFPVFDDQCSQHLVFLSSERFRICQPFVVAAGMDVQHSVHGANPEDSRMLLHKGVLYRDSFAKYASAFFRCRAPPAGFDSLL